VLDIAWLTGVVFHSPVVGVTFNQPHILVENEKRDSSLVTA